MFENAHSDVTNTSRHCSAIRSFRSCVQRCQRATAALKSIGKLVALESSVLPPLSVLDISRWTEILTFKVSFATKLGFGNTVYFSSTGFAAKQTDLFSISVPMSSRRARSRSFRYASRNILNYAYFS